MSKITKIFTANINQNEKDILQVNLSLFRKKKTNENDGNYHVKVQTKDRNVLSNLIHHLAKYMIIHEDTEQNFLKIV